jgi:hypothetical protein
VPREAVKSICEIAEKLQQPARASGERTLDSTLDLNIPAGSFVFCRGERLTQTTGAWHKRLYIL